MNERREYLIQALDAVCGTVKEVASRNEEILHRASDLQQGSKEGGDLRHLVASADGGLLVNLMKENLEALAEASSRLRRAQVLALYEEGSTTEEIARIFGVTRQRISTVLREARSGRAVPV